jgi:predicted permease
MKQRIGTWLDETRGTVFELLRHFLGSFFGGGSIKLLGGAVAVILSLWILFLPLLIRKYGQLRQLGFAERLRQEFSIDVATFSLLCVFFTMLLAGILWHSLYPNRADYLALAALPVRPSEVFAAKFIAVILLFGGLVWLTAMQAAAVLYAVAGNPLLQNPSGFAGMAYIFASIAGPCAFVFFSLVTAQGIMLNLLRGRAFQWGSGVLQALTIATAVALFPFAARLLRNFYPLLERLLEGTWHYAAIPPLLACATYALSYRRYSRLVMESTKSTSTHDHDWMGAALHLWIRCPREQASFLFIAKTLFRSRTHRLACLIFGAVSAAWIIKNAVDFIGASRAPGGFEIAILGSGPLTLMVFTLIGLRHMFSLPAELGANWLFQITEREGRLAWMLAVERFAFCAGIVPLAILSTAVVAAAAGVMQAIAWAALASISGAIVFEYLFLDWRKMPFTCSKAAGDRPIVITLAIGVGLLSTIFPLGYVLIAACANPIPFMLALSVELVLWRALRLRRISNWGLVPLRYEEQSASDVDTFGITTSGTVAVREQFQRAWREHLENGPEVPIVSPLDDDETVWTRLWVWCKAAPQDLKYAARMLSRNRGFGIAAVLTLGLGLGLNAVFFTIFNAFAFRPLAIREPKSVVSVDFENRSGGHVSLSAQEFLSIQPNVSAVAEIASHTFFVPGLAGVATKGEIISSNYLSMLGVQSATGRLIQRGETAPVIVLSHRLWQTRFASDRAVVGRKIEVDGYPFEVIGVTGVGFTGLDRYAGDFWIPLEVFMRLPISPREIYTPIAGRLRPGVSVNVASQILAARAKLLAGDHSPETEIFRAVLEASAAPLPTAILRYLLPLFIAFGLTMAIPCANTANMMLARAILRRREIGVRLALGATRGRVVRELLAEGLLISILAACVGLALARFVLHFGVQLITATAPPTALFLFTLPDLSLNVRVFLAMAVFAGLTAILFALAPAAQATHFSGTSALRGEFESFRTSRLRDALVAGQVAMCTVLLVVSVVLARGTGREAHRGLGYDTSGVMGPGFDGVPPEAYQSIASALKDQPWVKSMAFMRTPPTGMNTLQVGKPGHEAVASSFFNVVSPGYFDLLRLPILRGRTFTELEAATGAPVTIVSNALATKLWPGEDPIGKTLALGESGLSFRQVQVVGVSRDIVGHAIRGEGRPTVHFAGTSLPGHAMPVWIRGTESADVTKRRLEVIVARARGSNQGIQVMALREWVDFMTYPLQVVSWLSSLLGGVALVLTLSGMYAGVSYAVSHRFKELAIRTAVGATRVNIATLVVLYASKLTAVGLIAGGLLAISTARYLASIGSIIDFYDAAGYLIAMGIVVFVSFAAVIAPMRRACSVDPMEALRTD